MASHSLPVTELSNELTDEIDAQNAVGFARTLRATDGQIFAGWRGRESIFDARILHEAAKAAHTMALLLRRHMADRGGGAAEGKKPKASIVFTGCGTSGRIGFLVARRFNAMLRARNHGPVFRYLISGGDSALLLSDELPEDDPVTGAAELQAVVASHEATLLVGITCGLSAPYVAGQLDLAMKLHDEEETADADVIGGEAQHKRQKTGKGREATRQQREARLPTLSACVVGFNAAEDSRDRPIELWADGRSFRDVLLAMRTRAASDRRFSIVNPILGPEPIAGSSRMKGGSATAVLLDAMCMAALKVAVEEEVEAPEVEMGRLARELARAFTAYASAASAAYTDLAGLAAVMDAAAAAVKPSTGTGSGGASVSSLKEVVKKNGAGNQRGNNRLCYVSAHGGAGCMAFIDASEMPDTYGAPFDETRAFLEDGWAPSQRGAGAEMDGQRQGQPGARVGSTGIDRGVLNAEGDLSARGPLYRLSLTDFRRDVLPGLGSGDCVILLPFVPSAGLEPTDPLDTSLRQLARDVRAHSSEVRLAALCCVQRASSSDRAAVGGEDRSFEERMRAALAAAGCTAVSLATVRVPDAYARAIEAIPPLSPGAHAGANFGALYDGFGIFALKLMLNAVSTYAQAIGKGAVYKGRMICTGPTNDKIYARCVRLVAEFSADGDEKRATEALLKAIYRLDELPKGTMSRPTSDHIKAATPTEGALHETQVTLPLAFLLARRHGQRQTRDSSSSMGSGGGNGDNGDFVEEEEDLLETRPWTVASALEALRKEPRVSQLLAAGARQCAPPPHNAAATGPTD